MPAGAGDPGLAEDAAQEAVLVAMVSLDRLERPERFGAWLGGIGLNVCRRWRRDQAREAWSLAALTGGRAGPDPVPDEPAERAEAAEAARRVRRAVGRLPAGQRAAVVLFYLVGMAHREVAAALGIGVGTVKTGSTRPGRPPRGAGGVVEGGRHGGDGDRAGDHAGGRGPPAAGGDGSRRRR